DIGLAMEERGEVACDRAHLVRLEGEDHEVLRSGLGDRPDSMKRVDRGLSVALDEPQSRRLQRAQMGATRDERHIDAGAREPRADKATDRARAHDADLHAPSVRSAK